MQKRGVNVRVQKQRAILGLVRENSNHEDTESQSAAGKALYCGRYGDALTPAFCDNPPWKSVLPCGKPSALQLRANA